jgi:choline dehydrogenase-like flavoprotein
MRTPTLEDLNTLQLDYIIIGGGTAGLAVAARLSEDTKVQVAVIEAGPSALHREDNGTINIPGRYGETIGSEYDWQFKTTSQPGLGGRSLPWPRGRVLGGTSALNFMAWNRGHRDDYDAWVTLGNSGWGWEDLLYVVLSLESFLSLPFAMKYRVLICRRPFFRRSENFHPPSAAHQGYYKSAYDPEVNGTGGPLHTSHIKQYGIAHQYWHDTLNTLGVESIPDSLAGANSGAWNMVCTLDPDRQERSYSASAYYAPIAGRTNLHILTDATVLEIILEIDGGSGWVARGVKVRHGKKVSIVRPIREIILSAGSVQSPQLLELSGIGQREILEAAGIDVKIHNPNVGENLQDHMSRGICTQPRLLTDNYSDCYNL